MSAHRDLEDKAIKPDENKAEAPAAAPAPTKEDSIAVVLTHHVTVDGKSLVPGSKVKVAADEANRLITANRATLDS